MRIQSAWTLAAVQVLGLLVPRAALCAPSMVVAERDHDRDGQRNMNMMVPSAARGQLVEETRDDSSSDLGIDSLFTFSPYKIPFPPLFAESPIQSSSSSSSSSSPSSAGSRGDGGGDGEKENENADETGKSQDQRHQGQDDSTISLPSRYYSTLLGRRLLALSSHGVLTSIFPSNLSSVSSSARTAGLPASVADTPIGLPEYIASCEEPSGNPTILSLKVSTATRNAAAGSNVSLALSWWDEYIHLTGQRPWALANLPRLSLTGYLEEIPAHEVSQRAIESCFLRKHRDSVMWLPGRKWAAHQGFWTRLVVTQAYWIGGFGDKNYIGWFDPDEWRTVRREDWEGVRLPGEKD
ncbi:uncharacterized protein Z519_02425 [Cladophialophora bantiana CBS 173.52]|uniref:CREG-like beta-barrel domain-containing protein n=1 Tax=Cladophialophora bantiana (strain ATCC 10958 / CBS 173.52 / CDC B-1940 / NIH 8579) TaxID=1442370 RepID=A0A0D2HUI5_CLAB1|nr:uncharacterized protein Z519_02425 [Cladophialophora bantiana CBS 173.52]KIW97033.1 hypothetical protein Z519_02425 [Cladophialophora bantiana CBS 173.52]